MPAQGFIKTLSKRIFDFVCVAFADVKQRIKTLILLKTRRVPIEKECPSLRLSLPHKQSMGTTIIILSLTLGALYLTRSGVLKIFAATSPWNQTDWSGGIGSSTLNQYYTASNVDTTTTANEFSLTVTDNWSTDYDNWQYRKKIAFDNTNENLGVASEALIDFPVLVKLDGGVNIDYTKTQDSGQDIRFTDSDGTVLFYEIEGWDETGSSYVWVNVPQIDIDSNTDYIYMYYGNPGASDGQNASDVWGNSYAGVYHMNNDPSGSAPQIEDSTSNGINGTTTGSMTEEQLVTGKIGQALNFDGGDTVALGSSSILKPDDITIETWVNVQDQTFDYYNGVISSMPSWGSGLSMHTQPSSVGLMVSGAYLNKSLTTTVGTWYHMVGTHNSITNATVLYLDGVLANSTTREVFYVDGAVTTIGLFYTSGSLKFTGYIDEVRISNTCRSAAWVAANHHSETSDFITFDSEVSKFTSSGTLTSNIFDAGYASDWENLTYTTSGSGTVTVKVRTSASATMEGATDWDSCSAKTSGTDLTGGCVTDTERYVQYQVTLEPSGAESPVFEDIIIAFSPSDQIKPATNATNISMLGIGNTAWTNTDPTISWTAGADNDGGGGLLGYCISLDETSIGVGDTGTSSSLDPESSSGKQYYFSIKAVDLSGNIWTGSSAEYQDLISFKYDNTPPSNPTYISLPGDFISTKSVTITWPTSGVDSPNDANSGLAGLQYRIGSAGTWYGDSHNGDQDATDLLTNDGNYTTSADFDYENIAEGSNIIYFRTWDIAGNTSTSYVSGTIKVNTTAPSSPRNLEVSPTDSATNDYSFTWDPPSAYTGQVEKIVYCYTINTTPTANTCNYTSAGETSLSSDAYATQPGTNTLYLVAKDEAENINYDTYTSTAFTYSGSAPGIAQNLDIADVSVKTTSSWKLALSWEAPASLGAGVENYKIYHSTNNSNYTLESTVTGISYVDTGLTQDTHYYKVKACDSANNCGALSSEVSLYPDGKYTTAPTITADPVVSSVTTKRATITWGTNRAGDSKISYGTGSGSYYDEEPSNSTQTTDHSISLTNLEPGATYFYKAKWTDEDGNTGESEEFSFNTDPAPVVKDVSAKNIGLDSALVQFTSTGASKVKIYYGKSTSFGGISEAATATSETTYTTSLEGLEDGAKYYYKINTIDSEGDEYEGTILDFITLPRPKISNVRIQQVAGAAQSTVLVTWESNTEISSIITYYPQGDAASAKDEVNVALIKENHKMIIRGLIPQTTYSLYVKGRDKAGNEASSDAHMFTTATDTRPPQIADMRVEGANDISAGTSSEESTAQLVVSWNTDEPATSQVEFGEGTGSSYSQNTPEETNLTLNHTVVIPNLTASKVYHLRAISKDTAGNLGNSVDTVTITPKATENALDLVVSNLQEAFGFLGKLRK